MKEWYYEAMLYLLEDGCCAGITGEQLNEYFEEYYCNEEEAVLTNGKDYLY